MALTGKLTQTDALSKCVVVYIFNITPNRVFFYFLYSQDLGYFLQWSVCMCTYKQTNDSQKHVSVTVIGVEGSALLLVLPCSLVQLLCCFVTFRAPFLSWTPSSPMYRFSSSASFAFFLMESSVPSHPIHCHIWNCFCFNQYIYFSSILTSQLPPPPPLLILPFCPCNNDIINDNDN